MARSSPFEVSGSLEAQRGRLTVSGELDIANRPELEDEVDAMLARGARHLVIDIGELSFIDSSGLGLLVVLSERAAADGWTLGLTPPHGQVLSVVKLTGADSQLPFSEDLQPS